MTRMACLTDAQMMLPWAWRESGPGLEVRDAFQRSLEAENARMSGAESPVMDEVAAALALAQRAAGDLCGLIAGQPGRLLDELPGGNEWSLREVLKHTVSTEARFCAKSLGSPAQGARGADEMPASEEPTGADVSGDFASIVELLLRERATTDATFASLTRAALDLAVSGRLAAIPV